MTSDGAQVADPLLPTAEAALAAWAARVQANAAQVERYSEQTPRADHYAPLVQRFQVDPRRQGDPVLEALVALTRPGDTWLDIGAGAGRYALPLALQVREVIAVDASPGMLDGLRSGMSVHGIANVRPLAAAGRLRIRREPTRRSSSMSATTSLPSERF
jgi:methylase of polypeptide subunit release factors